MANPFNDAAAERSNKRVIAKAREARKRRELEEIMAKREQEVEELELYLHAETDLAVLMSETDEEALAVWLPKSQIEMTPAGSGLDRCYEVEVPHWLALDKGLI